MQKADQNASTLALESCLKFLDDLHQKDQKPQNPLKLHMFQGNHQGS